MMSSEALRQKARWVRAETLKLHKLAPGTRIASSLSDVEILVVLYYGGLLTFHPQSPLWDGRDRFIVSKGHGAISMYPILADLGFFGAEELGRIAQEDSFLGVIPDTRVPGFETINGSVGHGIGVAAGVALALDRKGSSKKVFVLAGDGELNSGAMWEAIMFAGYHRLGNLIVIVDNNRMSMLGYQKDILGLEPFEEKFRAFHWRAEVVDGHDVEELSSALKILKSNPDGRPAVLIADTVKGKGVPELEGDPLCHVKTLSPDRIDEILREWK